MEDQEAFQTNPASLYRVQGMDRGEWHDWTDDELSTHLLRELSANITTDAHFMSGPTARKLVGVYHSGKSLPNRLIDLFRHPSPPIELLEFIKDRAKSNKHHPDSPLQKISTVLYYSAIVVALLRCKTRITHLDDTALRYGVDWVLSQPWIDVSTRRLFTETRQYLDSPH